MRLRPPRYDNFFLGILLINLSKFLVNFCEYILKIALSRSIFQPKMHQIVFSGRTRWGSLQHSSRPPSWIKGSLLLREWDGKCDKLSFFIVLLQYCSVFFVENLDFLVWIISVVVEIPALVLK